MPIIKPSSELRNNYNEISQFCHQYNEPVYITKNGKGDLAVMSIETFERLVGKFELHKLLNEGMDDLKENKVRPFSEALADIQKGYNMDIYKIQITESAENDLRAVGLYISNELLEFSIAKKVVSKIGESIIKSEKLPLRNALVSDDRLALQGIRRILVDNYIVFYIVTEETKTVTIIRILYNRRDWINLL